MSRVKMDLPKLSASLLAAALCLLRVTMMEAGRQQAAQRDALVVDAYGNCDDVERTIRLIKPEVVTLRPGVTVLRCGVNVTRELEISWVDVDTFMCDGQTRDNCVRFLNWKRDSGVCALATAKDMLWTPLFNVRPPLRCPVIAQGIYQLENGSFDTSKLSLLMMPKNKYFRVKFAAFADKRKPYFCATLGGIYKTVKV
ncbi:Porphobilinogen deaminase [Frankliniella fusca]|uniref:Porphobilinogen deaminase n=1 Tax=Frankliniella fusca TaxID=407009 RepID=A0AAE1GZQ3_9NEOP|nr:Porphobilinogen deaminase [Frankliniella fusca]